MKKGVVIIALLLVLPSVLADCDRPLDGKTYTESKEFCGFNYKLLRGITITGHNLIFDCKTAVLQGDFDVPGITIKDSTNIVLENCHIALYEIGILMVNSTDITLRNSGIVRNNIGIQLEDSSHNYFERINDISLKEMVKIINATDNYFDYVNKDIEADLCRYNHCNKVHIPEEQTLLDILNAAIKAWLTI